MNLYKVKKFWAQHTNALMLYGIFVLALLLRLYRLDYQSFWLDEYRNILMGINHAGFGGFALDIPPGYIVLLRVWFKFVPVTETMARLPGAIIGSLVIFPYYYLGKKIFNKKIALLACFFLAISALYVDFSQEAKYYPLNILFGILMMIAFLHFIEAPSRKHFAAYAFISAAGLYCYYYLGILFLIQLIFLGVNHRIFKEKIGPLLLGQTCALVLFLPILYRLLIHFTRLTHSVGWIPKPTLSSAMETGVMLFSAKFWQWYPLFLLNISQSPFLLGIFVFLIFILVVKNVQTRRWFQPHISLMFIWVVFPVLFFYSVSKGPFSLFHIRYILRTIIPLYLIFAWLAVCEKNFSFKLIFIGLFVFINSSFLWQYYRHPMRPQWREAAAVIASYPLQSKRVDVAGYSPESLLLDFYISQFRKNHRLPYDKNTMQSDITFPRNADYWIVVPNWGKPSKDEDLFLVKRLTGVQVYLKCDGKCLEAEK